MQDELLADGRVRVVDIEFELAGNRDTRDCELNLGTQLAREALAGQDKVALDVGELNDC